jgi:hypothetical protein
MATSAGATRPADQITFAHNSERQFARLLDFYRVEWEYEPTAFPIEWDLAGQPTQHFRPDFYLPGFGLYIEITTLNQRLVTKKNRKVRRLRELYPDVRIKVLYQRDYLSLLAKYGLEPPSQMTPDPAAVEEDLPLPERLGASAPRAGEGREAVQDPVGDEVDGPVGPARPARTRAGTKVPDRAAEAPEAARPTRGPATENRDPACETRGPAGEAWGPAREIRARPGEHVPHGAGDSGTRAREARVLAGEQEHDRAGVGLAARVASREAGERMRERTAGAVERATAAGRPRVVPDPPGPVPPLPADPELVRLAQVPLPAEVAQRRGPAAAKRAG